MSQRRSAAHHLWGRLGQNTNPCPPRGRAASTWSGSSASAVHPLRFFIRQQSRYGDKHVYTPRTRFLPTELLDLFTCESPPPPFAATVSANRQTAPPAVDMVAALSSMWQ